MSAVCGAPLCERPAAFLAYGLDFDGSVFADEPVCESCASYLMEVAGTRLFPIPAGWTLGKTAQ